ncbi:MAG: agmatinase [Nitrospinota bacterium]|nr:MAG: agmatinase [Nitrospinota bacterium]
MVKMEDLFVAPQNFGGLVGAEAALETAQIVILPVPYEQTTSYRGGTREGPAAIIEASRNMELYDEELAYEVYRHGIYTAPGLAPLTAGPAQMLERVYETVRRFLAQEKFVVMLGGEHSLSYGMVKALREYYPALSVLQLDAHADMRDEYLGSAYNHACVMRRISQLVPCVQVGIRSLSREEAEYLPQAQSRVFFRQDLRQGEGVVARILEGLSEQVFLTIDLDVFDPAYVPAVGTPEPDGLDWHEVLSIIRQVATHKQIVGFDVVELSPLPGMVASDFLAAKLVYKVLGYCFYSPTTPE